MSITIRFLRERGDLRWRAIECVLVFFFFFFFFGGGGGRGRGGGIMQRGKCPFSHFETRLYRQYFEGPSQISINKAMRNGARKKNKAYLNI